MQATRKASDALGEVEVDARVLWGAQTQRALAHFAIGTEGDAASGGERMPTELLRALLLLKGAAAAVNGRLRRLPLPLAQAIDAAATELLGGGDEAVALHFPLSLWQSGSGTQSHMNVNEVLARLAELRLGEGGQPDARVHPNDHVNLGQSSNDMVPTAMHVAVITALRMRLLPALAGLAATLQAQAAVHEHMVKLGRTHLQDAVPMTVGQEIGAWRSQLRMAGAAIDATLPALHELAIGGTAVGTGLNTHPQFAQSVCGELELRSGVAWQPAPDRFAALAGHEPLVALHGALKTLAVALMKIANDVRLLASGPRAGLAELLLPANEPGSSIMPGKVNPTQCEALVMVCCQVIGNDMAVTLGAAAGHLQLNTCKPLIAANVLRSVRLLGDAMASFDAHTARGMAFDAARVQALLSGSLMLVTALAPHIGYDQAARIAHRAHAEHTTLREAAISLGVQGLDFDRWADPRAMLGPG
jgi:fumarate hydratase, class II